MIENSNTDTSTQRPVFLTILCVLTFISAGMGALSAITTPLFSDVMVGMVNSSPIFEEKMRPEIIMVLQAGWGYYLATFIFAVGSLIGAIMMWNMRKMGFHFYALSNLGLLFVPTLFLQIQVGMESILMTLAFMGFYGVYLKLMK
jgi:hypothetical protein